MTTYGTHDTNIFINARRPNSYGGVSQSDQGTRENESNAINTRRAPRVLALDLFRGMLMLLESIDHARSFMVDRASQVVHETWYEQPFHMRPVAWLARMVTHPAAPGFAFMMGWGIVLFAQSRIRLGWKTDKLIWHFIIRGVVLICLNSLFIAVFLFYLNRIFYVTAVLFALGVNFALGGFLFLLGDHFAIEKRVVNVIFLIGAILLAVYVVWQTPPAKEYEEYDRIGFWRRCLLVPGDNGSFYSMYPPLDWLSFVIYGIVFAQLVSNRFNSKQSNVKLNLSISALLFALFLIIRIPGKFGNINPELLPSAPEGTPFNNPYLQNWISFFNAIKYPPDLAFTTFYMGVNHLILAYFYLIPSVPPATNSLSSTSFKKILIHHGPLLAFGQSALFFFMIHNFLYFFMGLGFKKLLNRDELWPIESFVFWWWWLVGLGIMWILCLKYAKFKTTKGPDSLWRFF